MVFQNYALYPHMTVADNMGFRLLRGARQEEIRPRHARRRDPRAHLERFHANGRPAPARRDGPCHSARSAGVLFDEPLSNLDAKLRVQMRAEIKELHQRLKTTTVYVTHDQIEAMTLADKIVVMHDGIVEQMGTPLELYDKPDN